MSSSKIEKVECPHCHQEGAMRIWTSVNVDLNPELKERIFSSELFTYRCPHCGKESRVREKMIYHDMKNKFLILFDFFKPDDFDYSPPDIHLPPSFINKEGYTLRIVFGLNRLKEKILILEQALNDVAIERQKYMMNHILVPDVAQSGYETFFEKVETPAEGDSKPQIFFLTFDDEGDLRWRGSIGLNKYYEYCLSCRLDSRMIAEGFCCVDEGWISKRLKEG